MDRRPERARVRDIRILEGNWVEGYLGAEKFQAKIFTEPSEYGIDSGRVSKLSIGVGLRLQVNYDRGWDRGESLRHVWRPVVQALEAYAQTKLFRSSLEDKCQSCGKRPATMRRVLFGDVHCQHCAFELGGSFEVIGGAQ